MVGYQCEFLAIRVSMKLANAIDESNCVLVNLQVILLVL